MKLSSLPLWAPDGRAACEGDLRAQLLMVQVASGSVAMMCFGQEQFVPGLRETPGAVDSMASLGSPSPAEAGRALGSSVRTSRAAARTCGTAFLARGSPFCTVFWVHQELAGSIIPSQGASYILSGGKYKPHRFTLHFGEGLSAFPRTCRN